MFLLIILLLSQAQFFWIRYKDYLTLGDDPATLQNSLSSLDWVYQNSPNQGFYSYTYEPTVYDTVTQYLYYWYGRKKYGYVPCEYSSYPQSPDIFVPGWEHYQSPKKPCQKVQFLIIYPDENKYLEKKWHEEISRNTHLLEKSQSGRIKLEKRTLP